ncbi:MAG: DUF1080 domain-containing protein [Marinilabiliaceae bacterium]|nr:DUF1080 domain-containing protein [Marinilabiliaceae bacterium]
MKKVNLYLLVFATILASCQQHNVLTDAEKSAGWELLFDGETLAGWRDYNGTELNGPWIVENGTLSALGKGADEYGYLVTDKQYENFELLFDWKISTGGNSGVLYHVVEHPHFLMPYVTGPEYQLIDNEGFPFPLEDWQLAGADYAMYVADVYKTKLKPAGKWNNSKILFDNGHVEHWLNGEKIVEFDAWNEDWFQRKNSGKWDDYPEYGLASKGVIALQDHGDRVWFRNLKVRELPRKSAIEVDLFNGNDLHGWEIAGTELWYVEDGLLVCESGPDEEYGYLLTREYYDNFDLTLEFNQSADGNSGVFFRSRIINDVTITGWQCEVAPPDFHTGGIYESVPGGRGWLIKPEPENENVLKMGEWNTMRILVQGDNVTTWLNGTQMIDISDKIIGEGQGRIALQIHSGGGIKVSWRNLKLIKL